MTAHEVITCVERLLIEREDARVRVGYAALCIGGWAEGVAESQERPAIEAVVAAAHEANRLLRLTGELPPTEGDER